jgi:hypothetical protein
MDQGAIEETYEENVKNEAGKKRGFSPGGLGSPLGGGWDGG